MLCHAHKVSEDRQTVEFPLRPKAKFANGDPVNAQALKASYAMHITNAGSGASQLKVSGISSADRLEVVDDLTLRLHLDRPVAWGVISHALYPVSMPLAAITQGLIDLDHHSEPVPGMAAGWEVSHDLLTYTFRLRTGVLFHNGRGVDAAAVQWNLARMQDPHIGHPLTRSALANLRETVVHDTYTVQCRLHTPSAAFLADLAYYPCNLIAPDSVEQAHLHPIGYGPFKLARWGRMEEGGSEEWLPAGARGQRGGAQRPRALPLCLRAPVSQPTSSGSRRSINARVACAHCTAWLAAT